MNIEKLQSMINELEEHFYSLHPHQVDLQNSYRGAICELVHLINELKK